jgi:hypothetical protein
MYWCMSILFHPHKPNTGASLVNIYGESGHDQSDNQSRLSFSESLTCGHAFSRCTFFSMPDPPCLKNTFLLFLCQSNILLPTTFINNIQGRRAQYGPILLGQYLRLAQIGIIRLGHRLSFSLSQPQPQPQPPLRVRRPRL